VGECFCKGLCKKLCVSVCVGVCALACARERVGTGAGGSGGAGVRVRSDLAVSASEGVLRLCQADREVELGMAQ
jgi:hypothetical protein